jgi:hypothetical protein
MMSEQGKIQQQSVEKVREWSDQDKIEFKRLCVEAIRRARKYPYKMMLIYDD